MNNFLSFVILFGAIALTSGSIIIREKVRKVGGKASTQIDVDFIACDMGYILLDPRDVNIEDGPYGGDGGSAWTDGGDVHLNGPITAIEVHSGERIDAIKVRYGEVWADLHGGDGGSLVSIAEMGGSQPGNAGDPLLIDIVNGENLS